MKIYSYDESEGKIVNIDEVTISTDLETLANIRDFFSKAISVVESGSNFPDHLHLRDEMSKWDESMADIIILLNQSETE